MVLFWGVFDNRLKTALGVMLIQLSTVFLPSKRGRHRCVQEMFQDIVLSLNSTVLKSSKKRIIENKEINKICITGAPKEVIFTSLTELKF